MKEESTEIKVEDLETIFGVPMYIVQRYYKRYMIAGVLCTILDILLVFGGAQLIYILDAGLYTYMLVCLVPAIGSSILLNMFTKGDYKEAYKLYRKARNKKAWEFKVSLTNDDLFSVLFCSGYIKVKPDMDRSTYLESLRSACLLNMKYAKRFFKFICKYRYIDDENLLVFTVTKHKGTCCIVDVKKGE